MTSYDEFGGASPIKNRTSVFGLFVFIY